MLIDQVEQLVVHNSRLFWRAARDCLGRAMREVISHQRPPDRPQSFLCRRDLNHDVGAIAVFFDHLLNAADLPFDASKPF